ncbi:uncharacterized protein LOC135829882 [Sycon ciliatum]|uniref:uncharacterized protein LOC135829882 n=1 Tax=Sycon ciliatum TaxID=27933 RepID=UPI0031F62493
MSKANYVAKCSSLLEDCNSYEKLEMTPEKLDDTTKAFLKEHINGKIPKKLEDAVNPSYSRMPHFYGLPKDHKEDLPVRPVVSCCDGPTSNLSVLMERILNQLLRFVPSHLASTLACIQELTKHKKLNEDYLLVSLDVVGLYSNIPIADAIEAATTLLEEHREDVDMLGLSVKDVQDTLQFILTNNIFEFDNQQYRQLKGITMGNHLAPPLAIIFMSALENAALSSAEFQPCIFKRYIDDIIMLWRHGRAALSRFVAHLNNQHPFITFTITHSDNDTRSIDFLDLTLSVSPECTLEWELFVKPSHSGVHLSFLSSVPLSTKRAVAVNQCRRAISNGSTEAGRGAGIQKITALLEANDYPDREIQRAVKTAKKPNRGKMNPWKKPNKSILKLPFINDALAARVSRRVRQYSPDVRLVFTSGPSLKRRLVRSSFGTRMCPRDVQRAKVKRGPGRPMVCRACDADVKSSECLTKNVVYCMSCTLCEELYVGETERPVRERFKEHYREARVSELSAVKTVQSLKDCRGYSPSLTVVKEDRQHKRAVQLEIGSF